MEDNFISIVSTYFAFSGETSAGNGEDSYIISINENKGLIGVFDGCGGIGSRRYQVYDSKTGAYIAARAAGESSAEWFDLYSRQAAAGGTAALSAALKNALDLINSQAEESRIRGAMTRQFPTTLSLTVIEARNGGLYADFIWAGDSRGYILSGRGLTQISRDDIDDGYDALDNITSDGVLTNMVAADGNFVLHLKSVEITEPCIIFNATDGCFGYLKTPMEFEYMMLDTLAASDSVLSWRGKMQETVQGYTGDDHTIALAAFGFENFNEMQRLFRKRRDVLYRSCIKRLEAGENAEQLWNEYKKIYYEDMSG